MEDKIIEMAFSDKSRWERASEKVTYLSIAQLIGL